LPKPVVLASNLKKISHLAIISNNASSNTDNTITSDIDDTEDNEKISKKSKKLKTRMEHELDVWMKTMNEENKKHDEAKERRHQELLECQDKTEKPMNIL